MFYWYFKKKLNRAFKKNNRNKNFRSFDSMASVVILFDKKDSEQVYQIAKDMRNSRKKVWLCTLSKEDPHGVPYTDGLTVIEKKDVSRGGLPKPEIVDTFRTLQYDTLINLAGINKDKYDALTYLLAINNAEFVIGIEKPNICKPFDFILLKDPEKNLVETFQQIKLYTGNLR